MGSATAIQHALESKYTIHQIVVIEVMSLNSYLYLCPL